MNNETNHGGSSGEQLRRYIQRIEALEVDKANIAADIRDIYAQAKAEGFDGKIMRQVVKIRKLEPQEREEQESILDTYLHALGMAPESETE